MNNQHDDKTLGAEDAAFDCTGCGGCRKTSCEYTDVSLPIELIPNTCVGDVETCCVGEPCVQCTSVAGGNRVRLTVSQRVKIRIPIDIGVTAVVGAGCISCSTCNCDCN